jgi:Carboxypeptidase regulatory-like domain
MRYSRSGRTRRTLLTLAIVTTTLAWTTSGAQATTPANYVFSGTVTVTGGAPAAGIEVDVTTSGKDGTETSTTTAADGTFALTVPAAKYDLTLEEDQVSATIPYFSLTVAGHVDLSKGNATAALVLPVASLALTVVAPATAPPVTGTQVLTLPATTKISDFYGGETATASVASPIPTLGATGEAALPTFLGAQSTTGYAYPAPTLNSSDPTLFTIPAITTPTSALTVDLNKTFNYTGTVATTSGAAIPGAYVYLSDDSPKKNPGMVFDQTTPDGSYALNVQADPYTLDVEYFDQTTAASPLGFDITGNTELDVTTAMANATSLTQNFTVPIAAVTVNVVDANGNPVPGAEVALPGSLSATLLDFYNGDDSADATFYPAALNNQYLTDANGNYVFYSLIGAEAATATVTPPAGGTPVTFNLPTPTSAASTITVQLPTAG